MKKLILLATFSIAIVAVAQNKISVSISGLKNNNGYVMIGLYNKKDAFLNKTFKGNSVAINDKKATLVFNDIPNGEYAVSFFHDANSNGKMDTNFVGIPKESYGASNNAKGFFGPPKYDDAKFLVATDKVIIIKAN